MEWFVNLCVSTPFPVPSLNDGIHTIKDQHCKLKQIRGGT